MFIIKHKSEKLYISGYTETPTKDGKKDRTFVTTSLPESSEKFEYWSTANKERSSRQLIDFEIVPYHEVLENEVKELRKKVLDNSSK